VSKQERVSELTSHTGFWLRFVSNHVSQNFARKVAASGVTVAEWVILREMFDVDSTSPSKLAASMGITRGATSKLIDRLVGKALVSRTEAANDRRYKDVALTNAGRAIVPKLAALADQNDQEFFAELSTAEREQLVGILKKLVTANKLSQIPIE